MPKAKPDTDRDPPSASPDRPHLHRIVADISEGVILIEQDRRIVWANPAALVVHGCETLQDLGGSPQSYRDRFQLAYRDERPLAKAD